jgi:tryptophan 2,3-dioxygenase
MSEARPVSYWEYIRVEDLLSLQAGLAEDDTAISNEEVLFITVHQVFELWFKLVLRELRAARDLFLAPRVAEQELSGAVHRLRRSGVILRRAADHFAVMETLTTREFLAFRDKLLPASGFQSAQMRELEIVLGLPAEERIGYGLDLGWLEALKESDGSESPALKRVRAALDEPASLREAIHEWLHRTPIDGVEHDAPEAGEALSRFLDDFLAAHHREIDRTCERSLLIARSEGDRAKLRERYEAEKADVRAFFAPGDEKRRRVRAAMLFIETYRELPLLAWPREVLDGLVDLEEQFVIFRQHHARMVERVIGRRTGTGGSSGVDYLDTTALKYRVFRDLWAIRTLQVRAAAAPPLRRPEYYDFSHGE